jgi:hypothetical protein
MEDGECLDVIAFSFHMAAMAFDNSGRDARLILAIEER